MDLKHETAKVIAATTKNLAKAVAGMAFEFWERKDFRLFVLFEKISRTEQDRMFNELEVSLLGLLVLMLEHAADTPPEERRIVFSAMAGDLPRAFLELLRESGVEDRFIRTWDDLIRMRLKEYHGDYSDAVKMSEKNTQMMKEPPELRFIWARIETVTIDCLTHIRRGKVEKDDLLWKLLRKWFVSVDAQISPITQKIA